MAIVRGTDQCWCICARTVASELLLDLKSQAVAFGVDVCTAFPIIVGESRQVSFVPIFKSAGGLLHI
jgi:hypothetical protein